MEFLKAFYEIYGLLAMIAVMAVSFIIMYKTVKSQYMHQGMKLVALFVLLCVMIICLVGILYRTGVFGTFYQKRLVEYEKTYLHAKGYVLGRSLAERFPNTSALLIVSPLYEKDKKQQSLVQSIVEGFGIDISVGKIEPLQVNLSDYPTERIPPVEDIMKGDDFDSLIDKHPECNIVVSVIGLPNDVEYMKIWKKKDYERPKIALFGGGLKYLATAIYSGYIVASVHYIPGYQVRKDAPPKDVHETFNQRFLLVTPENVEETLKKYPRLFEKEK